jgi:AraC family transcriptional regulator of arabinose operon
VQNAVEVVFLHSGSMTVSIDGQHQTAMGGTMSLLLPGHREMIWFAQDRPTQHGWIEFVEPRLSTELSQRLEALPFSAELSERVAGLFSSFMALSSDPPARRAEIQYAAALQLFWEVVARLESPSQDGVRVSVVVRAEQFIEAHLADPVTLSEIAGAAGVSAAHLWPAVPAGAKPVAGGLPLGPARRACRYVARAHRIDRAGDSAALRIQVSLSLLPPHQAVDRPLTI